LQGNAHMKAIATSILKPAITGLAIAVLAIALRETLTTRRVLLVESAPAPPGQAVNTGQGTWADAVESARPAVVNIYTSKIVTRNSPPPFDDPAVRRFFGMQDMPQRERLQGSLGSGVVVSPSGYVVTNHHVIAGADEIRVALADGREAIATVIGTDAATDLAVLFIEMSNLPSITFEGADNARIGDIVLAIGNPFGVGQTVTQGIISALGRNQTGLSTLVDFIQTDAAINPGNSGGALINTQGHLIGINTAIYSKTGTTNGIGFAIPVSQAKTVLESLVQQGTVVRGWLGISPQIMTEPLANALHIDYAEGLLVAGVYTNGPAAAAGVQPGDILLKIDGQTLREPREALNYITSRKPGEHVTLEVLRRGQVLSVDAVVGTRPDPAA
jgi:serine protease DegS